MLFLIHRRSTNAFTLIEIAVVFLLIGILASIAYPTFVGVQNAARKTQAKNDLTQIVTAVNAFYTEYGKYPLATSDATITNTGDLFYTLRAVNGGVANAGNAANPRIIQYLNIPDSKDQVLPKSGIYNGATNAGAGLYQGAWYDPWTKSYVVAIDGTYDNQITPNPYSSGAGSSPIRAGVIAWSFGPDARSQTLGGPAPKTGTNADDVISWQ